jgi:AraC-like DNA-binding protein
MIVALTSDPILRAALRRIAHPEEDVLLDERLAVQALDQGFPRVVVYVPEDGHPLARRLSQLDGDVQSVAITQATLRGWEVERRGREIPPPRVEFAAQRLAMLVPRDSGSPTWVDRTLADLSKAAGTRLPTPFRAIGRRVMEFPVHYADLHGLSEVTGMSRGALKARFRRRALPSPIHYVRWFRVFAAAQMLSDRDVTTLEAADRLGFTTGGNFCRTVKSVTGLTSSEIRSVIGWNRLLVTFAWRFLGPASLSAWDSLDDLFLQQTA